MIGRCNRVIPRTLHVVLSNGVCKQVLRLKIQTTTLQPPTFLDSRLLFPDVGAQMVSPQVFAKLRREWVPIPAFYLCLFYVTYTIYVPSSSLQSSVTFDGALHIGWRPLFLFNKCLCPISVLI